MTAAHCVPGVRWKYNLRSGSLDKRIGGTLHRALRIIKHDDFYITSEGIPVNDIAFIEVRPPFKFGNTPAIIPLFNEEATLNSSATVSGWGTTLSSIRPNRLQAVAVPIISKVQCEEEYKSILISFSDGQICAAYPTGGKDACQGDSGGLLVIAGPLAGIVSWGIGCGEQAHPGVYAEVAYYASWIKRHISM